MLYCSACGESLPPAAAPMIQAHAAAPPPAAVPVGPVGATREPVLCIVLAIVTFGLYALYYWWVASREMDEHARKPGYAHNLVRIGTIVSLVAGVALFFAIVSFAGSLIARAVVGDEPTEAEIVAMVFGAIGTILLVGSGLLVGAIVRLVGKYRLWETLEAAERRRGHPTPLSAGLLLLLSIGSWFIPFVGWVLPLVVMYVTQDHLNQAWRAARG